MAGTKAGGKKTVKTIKQLYGNDFYERIGRKGGSNSTTGGFAAGEEGRKRASYWGRVGGRISKRKKAK